MPPTFIYRIDFNIVNYLLVDKLENEFVSLLVEIHLSDAVAEEKGKGDNKIEQMLAAKGMEQILKNKNLSRGQFDTIFSYYLNDPIEMKKIYTQVVTELSKKQAELVR